MANPRKYPPNEILSRLRHWCDRQERCHQEVRFKTIEWGYYYDDAEALIAELIEGNYLNEERFARAFVSGKFRIKKWGKQKIIQELKQKRVSDYCINKGLDEIDEDEYLAVLTNWIDRKNNQWKKLIPFQRKGKVAQFCINKGFEGGLVWEHINQVIEN